MQLGSEDLYPLNLLFLHMQKMPDRQIYFCVQEINQIISC